MDGLRASAAVSAPFHHSTRLPARKSITAAAASVAACSAPNALNLRLSSSSAKHLNIYHRKTYALGRLRSISASSASPPSSGSKRSRRLVLLAYSAVSVALAIANRVLYKLALVPMKEFPFFLAQLNTFGYVAIYFSVLYARYRAGTVTDEMLAFPKSRFIMIGFLEALGVVSGMYSGANLPGPAIPILGQTFLVWQLAFSVLLLGKTYSLNRVAGCFLVASGVVLAVTSGSGQDQMLSGVGIMWPILMIASSAFQAESVFLDANNRLKGKLLDIFVVNSFGSGFQAIFVLLFLPFLSNLKGIPLSELPLYLKSGTACFLNIGANTTGCDGAPLLPLLYVVTNIAFNISILNLLKYSSAVVSSLAVMSSVPMSIYILSRPLPYLPDGVSLSPFFVLGSAVLVMGLLVYNVSWSFKKESDVL